MRFVPVDVTILHVTHAVKLRQTICMSTTYAETQCVTWQNKTTDFILPYS